MASWGKQRKIRIGLTCIPAKTCVRASAGFITLRGWDMPLWAWVLPPPMAKKINVQQWKTDSWWKIWKHREKNPPQCHFYAIHFTLTTLGSNPDPCCEMPAIIIFVERQAFILCFKSRIRNEEMRRNRWEGTDEGSDFRGGIQKQKESAWSMRDCLGLERIFNPKSSLRVTLEGWSKRPCPLSHLFFFFFFFFSKSIKSFLDSPPVTVH